MFYNNKLRLRLVKNYGHECQWIKGEFFTKQSDSNIELDARGNVIVDENLGTNVKDVFAAGDIASFPLRLPIFEAGESRRVNVGHWQLALALGKCAGLNVAAQELTQIKTVPFFWTVQVMFRSTLG